MHNRRVLHAGQSTLEYAVLIAVVAAAAIGMQIYVKRGIQGRLRQSADQVGEQYAPGKTTSTFTTHVDASRAEATTEPHEVPEIAGTGSIDIRRCPGQQLRNGARDTRERGAVRGVRLRVFRAPLSQRVTRPQ